MAANSTIRMRRLGSELRKLRESRELDQGGLAKKIGTSQSRLSAVERGSGRKLPTASFDKLLHVLEVSPAKAEELRRLQEEAEQPGWWNDYNDVLPNELEVLAGLEDAATWVRRLDHAFLPAFLQTEEYARAVVHSAAPYLRSGDMPRLVEFRMHRQQRLMDPSFRFTALIGEAALYQQVGGPAMMRRQLEHLLSASYEADVEVLVVPFTVGEHAAQGQMFTVLSFAEPDDHDVVWVESLAPSGGGFLERHHDVRRLTSAFDTTAKLALSAEESLERIARIAEAMS